MAIRVIICSDSHGRSDGLEYLKKTYPDADYFIHCGDIELPKYMLGGFAAVQGNNDFYNEFPAQLVLEIGMHRILVVHGHRDLFWRSFDALCGKASALGCDIVCFGHTHIYHDSVEDGIRMLNPGSIWHNRDGSPASYMIMTLDGENIDVQKMTYEPKKTNRG